jgi:hypothetical protein
MSKAPISNTDSADLEQAKPNAVNSLDFLFLALNDFNRFRRAVLSSGKNFQHRNESRVGSSRTSCRPSEA